MSKIEKLSIQGVRAFGPLNRQSIEFETPLTLIVGYNGSGKTTIIECLKYATTGELPPNSKGGAFIHDPKLCGEREVKAQVRLKFKTQPDETYVVTRNLQLTVKKTQRSMKTLEGVLVELREGERHTASGLGNLDTLVPEKMGVGPAILESVIFCHQDESLWPMSEPAALKKRFDEIFEAQRYTKAIENLKVLKKKHGENLAKLKILEGTEKTTKVNADKCERRCVELQEEIDGLREKCIEWNQKMEEAARDAAEKHKQANTFLDIVNDLKAHRVQLSYKQENVDRLQKGLDELDEPDEWLEDAFAQYEKKVERYKAEHEDLKVQYGNMEHELGATQQTLNNKLSERGRYQTEKANHERQLVNRIEMIHQAAQIHSIRGFEGNLDEKQAKLFMERIQRLHNDKRRELDNLRKENSEEVDKKATVITDLEGRKLSKTQERVSAKKRIDALEKRTNVLQNDLSSLNVDEGAKALLDTSFQDLEKQLQKTSADFQAADFDAKIREESKQLSNLEAENDRLGGELMECTRLASDRAQLDYQKNELIKKKRQLDTLQNTWNDKLSAAIGGSWKPESVEQDYQRLLKEKLRSLEDVTKERDNEVQQLRQVQFTLSTAQEKAKKMYEELESCKSAVRDVLKEVNPDETPSVDNILQATADMEEEVLRNEKDLALFDEMKTYYQNCQKQLNKHNRCLLCERVFASDNDKSKLLKNIRNGLSDKEKENIAEDLRVCEEQLGKLRSVRSRYDTYKRLCEEKPRLDDEIEVSKSREKEIVRKLEDMDLVVRDRQEEQQDIESMGKTVTEISRTYRDIVETETQVERIISQQQSSSTVRSAEEIRELQDTCNEQMKMVKNSINKHQNDRQRIRETINSLELEKSRLTNKIADAVRHLERRKDIQGQIQSMRDDVSAQRDIIQQADQDLAKIEPDIAKAKAMREDVLQRGREKEKKAADERDGLASSISELGKVESDIQDYLDRGGNANLTNTERAIESLEQTVKRTREDMRDLGARAEKLKEEIDNSDGKKKNIYDNLSYRKTLREIDALKREITELEARDAQEDYERLMQEAKSIEILRDRLTAERGSMTGSMRRADDELQRLLQDWEQEYKDAGSRYREAQIRVESTKAVIEDLGQYIKVLDQAIMQYHTLKMDEVNRIALELWRDTYTGTDIDAIMIRSDHEASTGRRSYNYRVCMVKQDTEMDMRGRCSAGQKVLACIIIRLALAESFGTNCGLIALDEPTTNLDSDNIKSLAESLHKIIGARQAQRNFQLIVITHDEEFLRHMNCSDFCDYFYRVSRDEKQNSVIKRESITNVEKG